MQQYNGNAENLVLEYIREDSAKLPVQKTTIAFIVSKMGFPLMTVYSGNNDTVYNLSVCLYRVGQDAGHMIIRFLMVKRSGL